jgi:cytoskeletal protein RodZ
MPMELENEKLIKKFLLSEMLEKERFDFEERFITDADLFEQIKVVEDELIEKYVRGWMNSAERLKFEKHFLTTKKRRERVELSRQMMQKLEEQKEKILVAKNIDERTSEESFWQRLANLFLIPKIALAAAVAVLLAIFGSWFLYQNFGVGKPEIVKNQNSNVSETPEQKFTPMPEISPNQNSEIINTTNENLNENSTKKMPTPKESNENIEKTPSPTKTPIQKSAPSPVLALFAGTSRSGGKNNVLNLPKEANAATFQLNIESVDYKIFQAQLTDADGNVIYQKSNLNARGSKINFNVPAANLKNGDYIIKLFGKNDAGENESVADFQFRVNQ